MIYFSEQHRSEQQEIMDNSDFRGGEMKNLLHDLKIINGYLGGNKITIDGIEKLLKNHPKKKITILDVGCGDGELLKHCIYFGRNKNLDIECIGIDFNENILDVAKSHSAGFPNISFKKVDVFLNQELIPNCDIAVCGLFLHHFNEQKILDLLNILMEKSTIGLVINDLHRSRMAFNLFKIFSNLFLSTKTARHDGLISIAKGFCKQELVRISKNIPHQQSEINWRWAFRYQWIIKK